MGMKNKDKKMVGIGGMRCPCCTKGIPSYTKTAIARKIRRKMRITFRNPL